MHDPGSRSVRCASSPRGRFHRSSSPTSANPRRPPPGRRPRGLEVRHSTLMNERVSSATRPPVPSRLMPLIGCRARITWRLAPRASAPTILPASAACRSGPAEVARWCALAAASAGRRGLPCRWLRRQAHLRPLNQRFRLARSTSVGRRPGLRRLVDVAARGQATWARNAAYLYLRSMAKLHRWAARRRSSATSRRARAAPAPRAPTTRTSPWKTFRADER